MSYETNTLQDVSIPLGQLTLNPKNPRFVGTGYAGESEKNIIQYLCEDPHKKFHGLAEAMVENFDNRKLERILVVPEDQKNIVAEGNRRVAVYKLLENPSLAPSKELQHKYKKYKHSLGMDATFLIDCVVAQTWEEAYPFMYAKHAGKSHLETWGPLQRAYFKDELGNASAHDKLLMALRDYMQPLGIPDQLASKVLGKQSTDIFRRIVMGQYAKETFGLHIDGQGKLVATDPHFDKKLKVIIVNVASKKDFKGNILHTRTLNQESTINYLQSMTVRDYERAEHILHKPSRSHVKPNSLFSDTNEPPPKERPKPQPNPHTRTYLIPCTLPIKHSRINAIYYELREALPLKEGRHKKIAPNAVAVLFRVFLETSLDYFWEQKAGKIFAKTINIKRKIRDVTDYMASKGIAHEEKLKNIKKVAHEENSLLSIDAFHRYVHDHRAMPDPNHLRAKWDQLQEFFEILWISLEDRR